ncbi:ADP-heptose:LPS heptosyltransferase [Ignavibacterium album JCM 16511]|uniref:ADP-heptose:LPS heptosyltransferase n=1 Tax=Ignavibacterium album (strain DSM 19864 / JCM 16511 / NBRC 101810 / Mat9-16) TaxID=945713 RepID=I0AMY1_IGNAJ|nr:glycosyltransferase family 9 protein [Ignavibacterium album]AFH50338.1 ADP-heptose:LPS heptosyltransferase [Ignavibacterium album JCM 16511]
MHINRLKDFKRILIIRLSSLGDILLTTPFLRALKKSNPQLNIEFLLRQQYKDLLIKNPNISKLHLFSRNDFENLNLLNKLRREHFDLIIDLQNNFRSRGITSKLRGEKLRFDKKSFQKVLLVKTKINLLRNAPPIPVRYANVIDGIELDNSGLDLLTDKEPSHEIQSNDNLIGLCPGARHFTKRWPVEYFIELGKLLIQNKFNVVLFGGKIDKQYCERIANEIPQALNLCNDDDILQTAADMKLCSAIICNDSGLMHAASSTGTKVLTIFGSSVREFGFAPYNCKSIILENNSLSCRPCSHIGRESCPEKHFGCMKEIKPEFVYNELLKFLKND